MGTGAGALRCGGFSHGRWLHLLLGLSPQLSKEEKTFSFQAQQDFLVSNLQPATVSLYDYYETGEPCRAVSPGPAASPAAPGAQWGLPDLPAPTDELRLLKGAAPPRPMVTTPPIAGDRVDVAYTAPPSSGRGWACQARGHPSSGP